MGLGLPKDFLYSNIVNKKIQEKKLKNNTCTIICYRHPIKWKYNVIFLQNLVCIWKWIYFAYKHPSHVRPHTIVVSEVHIFSSLAWQTQRAKSNIFSILFYTRYKMLYYRYRYNVTATSNMKGGNLLCKIYIRKTEYNMLHDSLCGVYLFMQLGEYQYCQRLPHIAEWHGRFFPCRHYNISPIKVAHCDPSLFPPYLTVGLITLGVTGSFSFGPLWDMHGFSSILLRYVLPCIVVYTSISTLHAYNSDIMIYLLKSLKHQVQNLSVKLVQSTREWAWKIVLKRVS